MDFLAARDKPCALCGARKGECCYGVRGPLMSVHVYRKTYRYPIAPPRASEMRRFRGYRRAWKRDYAE